MEYLKKFLKAIVENGQMARDARTNNTQAQQIRDIYKAAASEKDPEKKALLEAEAQENAKQALIAEAATLPMYIAPINPLTEGLIGAAYGIEGGHDLIKNKPWKKTDSEGNERSTGERVLNTGLDAMMLLGGIYGGKQLVNEIKPLYQTYNLIKSPTSIKDIIKLNDAIKDVNSATQKPLNYISVLDLAVLSGKVGWSPSEIFHGRHGSTESLTSFYPKNRWDVVNRGASPYEYFLTDVKSESNMMDERPFLYLVDSQVKKPMTQIGEFNLNGKKNATRNLLLSEARSRGADGYILDGIADNKAKNQRVLVKYIDSKGENIPQLTGSTSKSFRLDWDNPKNNTQLYERLKLFIKSILGINEDAIYDVSDIYSLTDYIDLLSPDKKAKIFNELDIDLDNLKANIFDHNFWKYDKPNYPYRRELSPEEIFEELIQAGRPEVPIVPKANNGDINSFIEFYKQDVTPRIIDNLKEQGITDPKVLELVKEKAENILSNADLVHNYLEPGTDGVYYNGKVKIGFKENPDGDLLAHEFHHAFRDKLLEELNKLGIKLSLPLDLTENLLSKHPDRKWYLINQPEYTTKELEAMLPFNFLDESKRALTPTSEIGAVAAETRYRLWMDFVNKYNRIPNVSELNNYIDSFKDLTSFFSSKSGYARELKNVMRSDFYDFEKYWLKKLFSDWKNQIASTNTLPNTWPKEWADEYIRLYTTKGKVAAENYMIGLSHTAAPQMVKRDKLNNVKHLIKKVAALIGVTGPAISQKEKNGGKLNYLNYFNNENRYSI